MNGHQHVWDTETDDFSTFVPHPENDHPWVIHVCCEPRCGALKVTRETGSGAATVVYEPVMSRA